MQVIQAAYIRSSISYEGGKGKLEENFRRLPGPTWLGSHTLGAASLYFRCAAAWLPTQPLNHSQNIPGISPGTDSPASWQCRRTKTFLLKTRESNPHPNLPRVLCLCAGEMGIQLILASFQGRPTDRHIKRNGSGTALYINVATHGYISKTNKIRVFLVGRGRYF